MNSVSEQTKMQTQLCKLEITLPDCHVAVSRTIVVPIDTLLNALHVIIQKTMGWRNVHTHEFQTRTKRYGQKMYRGDDIENENFCILNHLVNARMMPPLPNMQKCGSGRITSAVIRRNRHDRMVLI